MTDRCPHCECYLEGASHYCLTLDQRVYHTATVEQDDAAQLNPGVATVGVQGKP